MTTTPELIERADGLGWLASTPSEYPLRFAVVGGTQDEAEAAFAEAVARWEALPTDR